MTITRALPLLFFVVLLLTACAENPNQFSEPVTVTPVEQETAASLTTQPSEIQIDVSLPQTTMLPYFIEGTEEFIQCIQYFGTLGDNDLLFSFFYDEGNFRVNEENGEYNVTDLHGSQSAILVISYCKNSNIQSLIDTVRLSTDEFEDYGERELGKHHTRYIYSVKGEIIERTYLIQENENIVSLTLRLPNDDEASEGLSAKLRAFAASIDFNV